MADDDVVLRVEQLVKDFGDGVVTRVLHGIDVELARGELVALIGPSGSGKSTLLNLVGLLDRPTSGRVVLQGRDTADLDDSEITLFRGRTLGFVFQFHHLLPGFTAVENVMLPSYAQAGYPSGEMRAAAAELLDAVGIGDRADARVTELSGGQQQRVAIARALAHRPALVLADEPTGNLDTASADEVFELMRRFNRDRGTTFLVVTHDARIADRCDRIIRIRDGRIVDPAPAG
jgi:lipoprotein-releasing system ATP-binding protein